MSLKASPIRFQPSTKSRIAVPGYTIMYQYSAKLGIQFEEEDIAGLGWGLGLAVVVDSDATPMIDRNGDFWWSGYYGTTFFVSPETGLVGVVLAQNQPGPFSDRPYAIYLAQAFAFWGL